MRITRDVEKWKEFGTMMSESYEEMRIKYSQLKRERVKDMEELYQMEQHANKLQTLVDETKLELANYKQEAEATIIQLRTELEGLKEKLNNKHVNHLARQVICLQTDLDKCQTQLKRYQRQQLTSSLSSIIKRTHSRGESLSVSVTESSFQY